MKDYTLTQQYVLIGLNGMDSKHSSLAKRAVVRGIPAAKFLEKYLLEEDKKNSAALGSELKLVLNSMKIMKNKEARQLELEATEALIADGVMGKIPDLLACDMNYVTAGVDLRTYHTDELIFQHITEGLRAEVLEEGPLTTESLCLLWLFREVGLMYDIFTIEEQKQVEEKVVGLTLLNSIYQMIWQEEFHSSSETFVASFLNAKNNLFKNPYLEGINLMYPFFDRRQAIFIDTIVLGTDVLGRRNAVLVYLSEHGHYASEVKNGSETLLMIDNCYYRIFPTTKGCKLPIQGVSLLPFYR